MVSCLVFNQDSLVIGIRLIAELRFSGCRSLVVEEILDKRSDIIWITVTEADIFNRKEYIFYKV